MVKSAGEPTKVEAKRGKRELGSGKVSATKIDASPTSTLAAPEAQHDSKVTTSWGFLQWLAKQDRPLSVKAVIIGAVAVAICAIGWKWSHGSLPPTTSESVGTVAGPAQIGNGNTMNVQPPAPTPPGPTYHITGPAQIGGDHNTQNNIQISDRWPTITDAQRNDLAASLKGKGTHTFTIVRGPEAGPRFAAAEIRRDLQAAGWTPVGSPDDWQSPPPTMQDGPLDGVFMVVITPADPTPAAVELGRWFQRVGMRRTNVLGHVPNFRLTSPSSERPQVVILMGDPP